MDIRFANAIFWIAVACCAVAQVAIVRSALVAPLTDGGENPVPRPRRPVEVLWTIVPAVGLALVLYATWQAIHATPRVRQLGHGRVLVESRVVERRPT